MTRNRKVMTAVLAVAAVLVIGGGIAIAQGATGGEEPLTGPTLDQASEAAIAEVGGGTVVGSEAGDGDGTYEVEVRRDDGTSVDVVLDADFAVVATDDDGAERDDADASGDDDDANEANERDDANEANEKDDADEGSEQDGTADSDD